MTLLIVLPNRDEDAQNLANYLRETDGEIDVRVWPDIGDPNRVEMVVTWRHPPGLLATFNNLRLVVSFGAGVEHLLEDHDLSENVTIVRTVDSALVRGMAEYVVLAIADWRRGWSGYKDDQRQRRWRPEAYPFSSTVLLMGAGRMGSAVARALGGLGHPVTTWNRSGQTVDGAQVVSGRRALEGALPEADAVVCLLPLTKDTEGILCSELFCR